MNVDQQKDDGWGEVTQKNNLNINSLPVDWSDFTREEKVQRLVDVVKHQIQKVRAGVFDIKKSVQVSALCLEGLMELSDFYADIESDAKNAKHITEYIESEKSTSLKTNIINEGKKVSETELKRLSVCTEDVKKAKSTMVDKEKQYKKWKYVYETLKESHVFFRNIGRM